MSFRWCISCCFYGGMLSCTLGLLMTVPGVWEQAASQFPHLRQLAEAACQEWLKPLPVAGLVLDDSSLLEDVPPTAPAESRRVAEERAEVPLRAMPLVRVSDSNDRLAALPAPNRPAVSSPAKIATVPATGGVSRRTLPLSLITRLETLETQPVLADWAAGTADLVRRLTAEGTWNTPASIALTEQLARRLTELDGILRNVNDLALKTEFLRARHALARRLEIWEAAVEFNPSIEPFPSLVARQQLSQQLAAVSALTRTTPEGENWNRYLMLAALQELAEQEGLLQEEQRQLIRQVRARISSSQLSRAQRQFIQEGPIAELDTILRGWLVEPIDVTHLLADMEEYEDDGRYSTSHRIAHSWEQLAWSPIETHQHLARKLDRNYRNANLRLAISGELINRLVPRQPPTESPIHDYVLGADVEGYSWTTTKLFVRLLPHENQWRFGLEARGEVNTSTQASSGPAVFSSAGNTRYLARKLFVIKPTGLSSRAAVANASGLSDLLALDTDFDHWPFVGSIVRNIAQSQHAQSEDQALWLMEQKVADTARQRLDQAAHERMQEARKQYEERILAPLEKLSLQPTPLELTTTEQRLVARLRLASDQQLAAHTPRPQAPSDSLFSVQVHETLFTNALAQLKLDGKTFTLPDLYQHVADKFNLPEEPAEELPRRAKVTFAPYDAVRVRCDRGIVELTLSIAHIADGRNHYRNFQVRAYYRPTVHGLHAELARDDVLELVGDHLSMGERIVLGAIFSKLLARDRRPQLVRESLAADKRWSGLEVTQLVIDDGWVGLAIGPATRQVQRSVIGQKR